MDRRKEKRLPDLAGNKILYPKVEGMEREKVVDHGLGETNGKQRG